MTRPPFEPTTRGVYVTQKTRAKPAQTKKTFENRVISGPIFFKATDEVAQLVKTFGLCPVVPSSNLGWGVFHAVSIERDGLATGSLLLRCV